MNERPDWRVHVALASAQLGFALFPVFGKLALDSIPPFVFAALRVTSAALLLETIRRLDTKETISAADRRQVFLFALLGVSFNQVLFILGLSLTTAIHTTILTAMIPVFTLAAAVLLKHERLTARALTAVLLAGIGALLLLRIRGADLQSRHLRGNVLLLLNGFSYSLYLIFSRPILARYRVSTFVAAVFRYGAILILVCALPSLLSFSPGRVSALAWGALAGVVLFCTVMPYLLNSWALSRTEASRVAFYVFVQPVISALLAIVILGEELTRSAFLASLLILAGLGISVAGERLPARPLP